MERLKNGQNFLDVGCCMGQDLRRLALDGVPTTNMYATDVVEDFWEVGYDLFRDRDTMNAHFVKVDILDANSALAALHGNFDVVHVALVLHLFGWAKQLEVCRQLVLLSKIGTAVLGCQVGSNDAGEMACGWAENPVFWHNVESFKEMWRVVEEDTRTRWTVKASLGGLGTMGFEGVGGAWLRPGSLVLHFSLMRIE